MIALFASNRTGTQEKAKAPNAEIQNSNAVKELDLID
jgi:hypothetical protein